MGHSDGYTPLEDEIADSDLDQGWAALQAVRRQNEAHEVDVNEAEQNYAMSNDSVQKRKHSRM